MQKKWIYKIAAEPDTVPAPVASTSPFAISDEIIKKALSESGYYSTDIGNIQWVKNELSKPIKDGSYINLNDQNQYINFVKMLKDSKGDKNKFSISLGIAASAFNKALESKDYGYGNLKNMLFEVPNTKQWDYLNPNQDKKRLY